MKAPRAGNLNGVTGDRIAGQTETRPDRAHLGGKAAGLVRLGEKGLPVPPWLVVTTHVFEEVLARIRPGIEAALEGVDRRSQADCERAASRIRASFLEARLAPADR